MCGAGGQRDGAGCVAADSCCLWSPRQQGVELLLVQFGDQLLGNDGVDCSAEVYEQHSNIRVFVSRCLRAVEIPVLVVVCRTFCRIVISVNACRSNSLLLLSLTGRGPEHLVSFVGEKKKNRSLSYLAGSGEFISLETEVHMVSAKLSLSTISF